MDRAPWAPRAPRAGDHARCGGCDGGLCVPTLLDVSAISQMQQGRTGEREKRKTRQAEPGSLRAELRPRLVLF